MYEAFFGLSHRPFFAAPDPEGWVELGTAAGVRGELCRCLEDGLGIALLTAPAGLGKTLLCRKLLDDLQGDFATALLPTADFPNRRALWQSVLYELGQPFTRPGESELRLELTDALREIRRTRRGTVLVVDEAHRLRPRLLEELRGLTNLFDGGEPLVRILLSGQPALEERLADPELAALGQRLGSHQMLEPLSRAESAEYIARRLAWAGTRRDEVFTAEAVALIGHASDGNPRCLNQLCDHSLLLAAAAHEKPVTAATIRAALDELRRLSLPWNDLPASWAGETDDSAREVGTPTAALPVMEEPADESALFPSACIEIGGTEPVSRSTSVLACAERSGDSMCAATATGAGEDACSTMEGCDEASKRLFAEDPVTVAAADGPSIDSSRDETPMPHEPFSLACSEPVAVAVAHVDEVIVDRYAQIDAGQVVSATEGLACRMPLGNCDLLPELVELRDDEDVIARLEYHSPRPVFHRGGPLPVDPAEPMIETTVTGPSPADQQINAVLPLLDAASEATTTATMAMPADGDAPRAERESLEAAIAAMVFESGDALQRVLSGGFDAVDPPLDVDDSEVSEPPPAEDPFGETDESREDADDDRPVRRFGTLFSRLRRRQRTGEV